MKELIEADVDRWVMDLEGSVREDSNDVFSREWLAYARKRKAER